MKKIVVAALVASGLVAAPAGAAGPANVTVRVEGDTQTLVPRTPVRTSADPVGKGGKNCSGTSALGALDQATAGDWTGTYFDDFSSWFVEAIKGERHASAEQGYWDLWLNRTHSDLGICNLELQEGDELTIVPNDSSPLLELSGVPSTAAPGEVVNVKVTEYGFTRNPDFSTTTTSQPADGATVTYGSASGTTGADGSAQLTFAGSGPVPIQATQPGHVRSVTVFTCVTSGSDGNCGTQLPPSAVLGTERPDDETAPVASFARLRNGKVYRRKRAPRRIAGSVTPDPSGLQSVRLSILRRVGKRCWAFDGAGERFERHRCGGSDSFRIGDRADWSYLLPKRLGRGRYTIRAVAIDKAGNDSASRVVIRVR